MYRISILLIASLCTAPVIAGINEWTSSGPEGGFINDIEYAPSAQGVVYLAAWSGMHKSVDGGATWQRSGHDFINDPRGIAVDPTNADIAYVTPTNDVFRTQDGGTTYTNVSSGLPDNFLRHIAIGVDSPVLYVEGVEFGIARSDNEGQTWTVVNNGLPESSPGLLHRSMLYLSIEETATPFTLACRV